MARSAIILVERAPLSALEVETLSKFRDRSPEFRFFFIRLSVSPSPADALFDRVIFLPLSRSDAAIAHCIGAQLALNEGFSSIGMINEVTDRELNIAVQFLHKIEHEASDVIVVQGGATEVEALFVSHRAAFIPSFWLALTRSRPNLTLDIIFLVCQLVNRNFRICDDKNSGSLNFYAPQQGSNSLFLQYAADLHRLIGLRIGNQIQLASRPVEKIAVITPYFKETGPELTRCMDSVKSQSYACDHFMISDGFPSAIVDNSDATHIKLGLSHSDNGNTPRYVGAQIALSQGYDGIAFLDADNWFNEDHIQALIDTQNKTGAQVVCSFRNIYLPDGHKLDDIDREDELRLHVDTSCYLFTRDCEYVAHLWGQMPRSWGPLCDRIIFSALEGLNIAWTNKRTLNFKSNYSCHYRQAGRPLPEKVNDVSSILVTTILRPDNELLKFATNRMARMISLKI